MGQNECDRCAAGDLHADLTIGGRDSGKQCSENELFRKLAKNAPVAMALIDRSGNIKYINPKFEELFGAPREPEVPFFTESSGYPSYFGPKPSNYSELAAENQHYADIAASSAGRLIFSRTPSRCARTTSPMRSGMTTFQAKPMINIGKIRLKGTCFSGSTISCQRHARAKYPLKATNSAGMT